MADPGCEVPTLTHCTSPGVYSEIVVSATRSRTIQCYRQYVSHSFTSARREQAAFEGPQESIYVAHTFSGRWRLHLAGQGLNRLIFRVSPSLVLEVVGGIYTKNHWRRQAHAPSPQISNLTR